MSALVTAIMQDITATSSATNGLIIETTKLGQWFSLLCCVVITIVLCGDYTFSLLCCVVITLLVYCVVW